MTQQQKPAPLIKAAPLWAKTSAKGGQYLTGRLGGMRVLILENRDRKTDDDPSHILYFAEAQPRQGDQERAGGQRAPYPPRTPQTPSQPHRVGLQGRADAVDGDMPEWAR